MNPYIISVSRREDIPAFKPGWFIDRIKDGYVNMNSFYGEYQISFEKTKLAIFWTKNPKPLIKYLEDIPFDYYFQFTLNDYPEYEKNVPPLSDRIQTFIDLSNKIGKNKVIWRYDPIIINEKINQKDLLSRIKNIGDQIFPYTNKLVFSYIDPYKKLGNKFEEIDDDIKISTAKYLIDINKNWGLKLSTCAEIIDLEGISHNKCIDPDLIREICGNKKWINDKKDKSQRTACGCMTSGDIGTFKQCRHFCTYCYGC